MAKSPKRKRCTFCGRLIPVKDTMPDPRYGEKAPICKDRMACVRSIPSSPPGCGTIRIPKHGRESW